MKPEEIEIFKDIRAVLSEAIDKLEALEAEKQPREFWIALIPRLSAEFDTYKVYSSKDDFYARGDDEATELIHVKEVVNE